MSSVPTTTGDLTLTMGSDSGLLVESSGRRIVFANEPLCAMFAIPVPPDALVGGDCGEAAAQASTLFADPEGFLRTVDEQRSSAEPRPQLLRLTDGRVLSQVLHRLTLGSDELLLWVYDDVTATARDQALLASVDGLLGSYFYDEDVRVHFPAMLDELLALTESEYGFIAEVLTDPEGSPYLASWAVSNIAWNDETRRLVADAERDGTPLTFTKLDSLYGVILRHGEVLIVDDVPADPRATGTPPGHPPLLRFLGIPLKAEGTLIGVIGLANRPGGYDRELVRVLEPFTGACATVIGAYRADARRREVEQELRVALAAARRANEAQNEFMSRVSHELRTPLNAVLGFAQLMERSQLDESQRSHLGHVTSAGRHLLRLVDDLLEIGRVESDAGEADLEAADIVPVVAEAISLLTPAATERSVALRLDAPGAVPAMIDPGRTSQVLFNLVSNAVKFGPEGSEVVVTVSSTGPRIVVEVADRGVGVPEELQHRLFLPFDRLDADRTRADGTGLGLTVARRLAESMGGSVTFLAPPGGGAVFRFEVDAAPV